MVDVVEVGGPLDRRSVDYVVEVIEASSAQLVVLQLSSPGAVDGDVRDLIDLVGNAAVPVAVWVGPEPAVAHGGAAQILLAAPIRGAAPGALIGYLTPTVAGQADDRALIAGRFPAVPETLYDGRVEITEPIPGVVEIVTPSIGQFIVGLDGAEVMTPSGLVRLSTARLEEIDGQTVTIPSADVRFREPGIITRTLRITIRPEAAFLFLVIGLAFAVFEFYAAGPGIAAAVAAVTLAMAGYGLAVLPTNWWAVAATLLGVAVYTADFQRNDLGWRSLLGTGLLLFGGLALIDASPQIDIVWWAVALVVGFAALFFGFAMTTVVRARFSTATIGREHLLGRRGVAASEFDPDGVVSLGGARWRAASFRAASIAPGDAVEVVAVDGVTLEVAPISE